jgi:uncharacterized protein YndB with AHSA1/START domain
MTEPKSTDLVFEVELPDAPEKVWRALTVTAFVDRWLMPVGAAAENDPARFGGTAPGLDKPVEVIVLDAEPFSRLRWRWQEAGSEAGIVTFTLARREDGGTSLSLLHERRITALLVPANGNTAMALAA